MKVAWAEILVERKFGEEIVLLSGSFVRGER